MQKNIFAKFSYVFESSWFASAGLFIILVLGFVVRLYGINNPLADWHSWRQVDTASVSKVFVENGIDLLHPRYHDISKIQTGYENPGGYRFVELPIFNAMHALLYTTWPNIGLEVWGRLLSIVSALLTTYFLYAIGKNLFNKWVGLASAFFYASLPFNIYFTRVILPDPLAVMLSMLAIYLFMFYVKNNKVVVLVASSVAFSLAMLVKPHAIFFALPLLFLYFSRYTLRDALGNRWLFVAVNIALIPFFLWRIWMYREGLIRGIAHWEWAFNGNGIRFRPAFWRWIFGERVGKLILGVWGVFPFLYGSFYGKKINIVHAFLAGSFLYVAIFASANVMHDYYQIFIMPSIALALGLGVYQIWTNRNFNFLLSKLGMLFAIAMMFFMSYFAVRDNWKINDPGMVAAGRVADEVLPKDALVIAPYNGDTTFLYHTGRWGWPTVTTDIQKMIEMGADYYISVNFSDPDTQKFKDRFEVVKETDRYIIIDLQKEKKL